ncbi:unnamed protein product [Linum tenue]|uniref:Uncharacterized protein n=1 Tax=Linum tenue TaxID=586396 RepID=A0AAV0L8E3_9ROSI|nr:unnamed protein product [Linum tenue]
MTPVEYPKRITRRYNEFQISSKFIFPKYWTSHVR